ncbi:STAS domain-containing protein [Pseudonocardia nigra]|uniref:STAS domain-containing protein n=1 Tax=Pseudonocardia nigra TaxID=1921578 RepID=UPI001C5E9212|nr:STAS domain-containing protein [Pseudonocardia nigra]
MDVEPDARFEMRLHAPTADVVVVRVSGVVDTTSVALLAERAGQQLTRAPHVVIHLGDVTFLSARGLAVLGALQAKAELCGTRMHLAVEHHAVLRPLHIAGLDRLLPITRSAEAAVAAVHR